jgi:DNA helicase-2/ATP-dependent DNA helicase PcrA
MYNPPSRFLAEIPEELVTWNEVRASSSISTRTSAPRSFGPPPKATGKRTTETVALTPGDRVSHDTFGLGTVVEVSGDGDRAQATINFGSAGEKRLLLRYAPVEKL